MIKTADGQSQIRRVPLPRIVDAKGNISFEELIGLVLVFTQTTSKDAKRYIVTLTYHDDEKDLITLGSTEELKEAIELFAEQKFLRIITCVKIKTPSKTPTFASNYIRGISASPPTTHGKSKVRAKPELSTLSIGKLSNAKNVGRNRKGKHLKVVNATKADEVARNAPSCTNSISRTSDNSPTETKTNIKDKSSDNSCKTKESEETTVDVPFIHGRHTCDGCLKTPIIGKRYHSTNLKDYDLCEKCYDNYKGSAIKYEAVELNRDLALQNFWRERHEKALRMRKLYQLRQNNVLPRVSPRTCVHLASLPNQGGQGSAVRQDNQTPCNLYRNKVSSTRAVSCNSNPATQNDVENSNEFDDNLKEAIRRSLDDVVAKKNLKEKSNESAEEKGDLTNHESLPEHDAKKANVSTEANLKEAIRRSLDDVVSKENLNEKSNENSEEKRDLTNHVSLPEHDAKKADECTEAENNPPKIECLPVYNVQKEHSTKAKEIMEINGDLPIELQEKEPLSGDKSLDNYSSITQDDVPRSIEIAEERNVNLETKDLPSEPSKINENEHSFNDEAILNENDDVADSEITDDRISGNEILYSTDTVEHKKASIQILTSGDSASGNFKSPLELKDVDEETMQKAMDTDSVDSEKLVSETTSQALLLKGADNCSGSPCSKQKSFVSSNDISFTSDAAGNGDVAEAMGKTLDMVAGVINEMLSESECPEDPNTSNETVTSESKQGELILNANDDVEEIDEEDGDNDWSVVESVESVESNGTTESEQIGRAAEMLGSALFNSELRNSAEESGSNMVGSDSSFSIPSSVPTDLGTVNSNEAGPNLENRWVKELEMLRELGFDSDSFCIEILERICSDSSTMADNIGRVVEELLSLNA
eukprot:CAMPEP_0197174510 /NCGR_PEP_ID=MMETSP1423-20130617/997_1 /TAXON_ID=476441 /ORGANISM="Pseudo-nitzschia heimii, Strain UNC1101" /LENGTH=877 /DNA_ID=CAMNT_0042623451 /DNA_START=94 /DNA_END=2727 /DNA_ORIENTATION=-